MLVSPVKLFGRLDEHASDVKTTRRRSLLMMSCWRSSGRSPKMRRYPRKRPLRTSSWLGDCARHAQGSLPRWGHADGRQRLTLAVVRSRCNLSLMCSIYNVTGACRLYLSSREPCMQSYSARPRSRKSFLGPLRSSRLDMRYWSRWRPQGWTVIWAGAYVGRSAWILSL